MKLARKALIQARKKTAGTPRCRATTVSGKACPFYQMESDGYWLGACKLEEHQAQLRAERAE